MSLSFIRDTLSEGANFAYETAVAALTPDNISREDRKICFWMGVAGIVASLAAKTFGAISTAGLYVFAGFSASLLAAGATGMILFTIPPIAMLSFATCAALANANIIWVVSL